MVKDKALRRGVQLNKAHVMEVLLCSERLPFKLTMVALLELNLPLSFVSAARPIQNNIADEKKTEYGDEIHTRCS